MRNSFIRFSVFLIMSFFSISCHGGDWPSKFYSARYSDLESYEYTVVGSQRGSKVTYSICRTNYGIRVSMESGEKGFHHRIKSKNYKDCELLYHVAKLLDEAGASEWKSSYMPEVQVLDGSSWNVSIQFGNEKVNPENVSSIRSSGYMAHPENNPMPTINRLIEKYSGYNPDVEFKLLSFEYSSTGTAYGDTNKYIVFYDEDGKLVVRSSWGLDEPDFLGGYRKNEVKYDILDATKIIKELSDLLDKAKVRQWKDGYNDPNVLDGTMWGLTADYEDDCIHSGGCNAWPQGDNCINEMVALVKKYSKAE